MAKLPPPEIQKYFKSFPATTQEKLQQIRQLVVAIAPEAVEGLGYGVPAFKLNSRPLLYYAAFKKHVAIYPAPRDVAEFTDELAAYPGGKGTIQFSLNKPLPIELIKKVILFRMSTAQSSAK